MKTLNTLDTLALVLSLLIAGWIINTLGAALLAASPVPYSSPDRVCVQEIQEDPSDPFSSLTGDSRWVPCEWLRGREA